jgi:hypothetical protein
LQEITKQTKGNERKKFDKRREVGRKKQKHGEYYLYVKGKYAVRNFSDTRHVFLTSQTKFHTQEMSSAFFSHHHVALPPV